MSMRNRINSRSPIVLYAYDSLGRRILEADILNRWIRHTEYRGLTMDVWKNAAVHGIKEPRDSRGIDSTGMVFRGMQDFLPAFADFSRASPYDFTHVALTLPLGMGGEVLGLLQTEHSGIGFNPFVNASHTDAERHYFGKDHLGSVRAVMNKWGSPLRTFDYDVFGQPLQDRPERFHYGFTGKEYDNWAGLYNYGFRDYSPLFGRFTTVDPVQDGHNWYAYVNSDPVSWLDPWGLKGQKSGENPARLVKMVSNQDKSYFDYNNFITKRVEGELNGVAAGFQDSLGKLKNFLSNIFIGKSQVETYYSVSVAFGAFSYEATMYVSEEDVTFKIPQTEELLTNTLQQEMKMSIILESNGVSADIPIGIYNSCELSIPVEVSKKEDDFVTLKLGAKASAKSPVMDSFKFSGSTGYRITASVQDGPSGTIKNRKSESLNTKVKTYKYYTSIEFLEDNIYWWGQE